MYRVRFFVIMLWTLIARANHAVMGAETADGKLFTQAPEIAPAGAEREKFQVLPGFQVERLFTLPAEQLGSWVSLCVDPKGRLLASDEGGKGFCRITPSPIGSSQPTKVEHLDVKISGAQGLLCAFDSLYASVNGSNSGLHRLRDTNGDDQYDEVQQLKPISGGGEHGPHALVLSPDGKSIYWIAGNYTKMPENFVSRLPTNWLEDQLLPRMWDAGGHAVGLLAPGGWIAKTDPDGKTWEVVSSGYRNAYDMAFNAEGELFAYDSDMEWDVGMPWYCPTRVSHATSGSELGWRSGSGRWPAYYPDSLPSTIDIGPGSPVGVTFGYGAKFPAKYQKALYILDWTFGTIHAIHLEPSGATYKATEEEFVARTPLPLTDAVIGADGALYFTIGGRGTQSELFRVTYVGNEPTAAVDVHDPRSADLRELRQQIETHHIRSPDMPAAVNFSYPYLGHSDRFIRYAARVALENQDVKLWQHRVLAEKNPAGLITGAIALARQGAPAVEPALISALDRLDFASLDEAQQLELLRAYGLIFIRLGAPDSATTASLTKKFDALFPGKSEFVNRELCKILVYLQSPTIVSKVIALLKAPSPPITAAQATELLARNPGYGGTIQNFLKNQPDAQKLYYAFVLRTLKTGWTIELRKAYFQFLREARTKSGGASYQGFLRNIDNEAFELCTEPERLAIDISGSREPFRIPDLPKPEGPGNDWTLSNLTPLADRVLKGRNFKNGQKMYAATRCVVCHRFNSDGGATGPDLTQVAGRFNFIDLCTSIVEPSKVVSDQYRATTFVTAGGKVIAGRVLNDAADSITVLTDPQDATKLEVIAKSDIEDRQLSPTSIMPSDLLKPLNENEVLDLLAYLLARGNPNDPAFQP
jgi:putative heme-binding domain-containing protein